MNIEDFNVEIPPGDLLETIFGHQRSLMLKYHEVEQKNLGRELPDPEAIDIDDQAGQLRLKEYAWRITEELAEATSCHGEELHMMEEMVDALHFTVEFDLMCGLTPEQIVPPQQTKEGEQMDLLEAIFETFPPVPELHAEDGMILSTPLAVLTWRTVERLGVAMNCLKNKPWKTTHMATDRANFLYEVIQFNHCLFALLSNSGFTAKTLTQIYLNKHAVNSFRLRSAY